MRIQRRFTDELKSPYEGIEFRTTSSEIRNPDGSLVFQLAEMEVPATWSQVACDVLAQKYFRKAGVPKALKPVEEDGVPEWLWRRVADEEALAALDEVERYGPETSAKQVFDRLAGRGRIGGGKAAISVRTRTRCRTTTKSVSCWPPKLQRPIVRNGSTQVFIGPTASTVRHRATISSTGRPVRSFNRKAPTNIRNRTLALSKGCKTISSTTAAS